MEGEEKDKGTTARYKQVEDRLTVPTDIAEDYFIEEAGEKVILEAYYYSETLSEYLILIIGLNQILVKVSSLICADFFSCQLCFLQISPASSC